MIHIIRDNIPFYILEEIIAFGEGYKTEFKETLPIPALTAKSLCAFANAKGGNIFIGINNSARPVGIKNRNNELSRLEQALILVLPKPEISVQLVMFKNKELMLVKVKEGKDKPYFVTNGKKNKAYIRTGEVNLPASRKTLKMYISSSGKGGVRRKRMKKDEKLVFELFTRNNKLHISQIQDILNYSTRRIRRILVSLSKYGFVIPSQNENNVFYSTEETTEQQTNDYQWK